MELSRSALARALALVSAMPIIVLIVWTVTSQASSQSSGKPDGWTIPPSAADETNPVTPSPQMLAAGRALFQKNCRRCHGPKGVGDGPDADPDRMADMDLTNPKRAADNPDGVVFYRIWNGRKDPKMPAFKDELSREQVWAIVSYVQTLRKPASE